MYSSKSQKRSVVRTVVLALFLTLALVLPLGRAPAVYADGPAVEHVNLVRSEGGVTMQLRMSGLPHREAVTVWWLINPGPGFPDDPGPDFSVLRAAGNIVGRSGRGNFGGHVFVGEETMFGPGLQDPHNDVIVLVVRTHGPLDPERILDQLFTPEDECGLPDCQSIVIMP